MPKTLFVTRHPGAIVWARRQGITAAMIAHLDPAIIEAGDMVLGTLPVHIAATVCARGGRYLHLTIAVPEAFRGREMTADDMDRFGAALCEFTVAAAPPG